MKRTRFAGSLPEELLGDGDPRKEMAARPAAGDDHPEAAAIR